MSAPSATAAGRLGRALLHVGLLEWVVGAHLAVFAARLALADDPAARPYLLAILGMLAGLGGSTFVYRRYLEGRPLPRLGHQALVVGCVFGPFFLLREMIPILEPGEVDAALRSIDLWLVGGDASVWLERFATPFNSAWLAAAYYGYYIVGGSFIGLMMLLCRRQERLIEFGLLLCGAACIADLSYTFLPARGPHVHLAQLFGGPLPDGLVVPFVHRVVLESSPLRDAFPSMHTCIPLCLFLFSARYLPWAALLIGLWLPQIVLSTLFLRYHYLVDVLAGAALAVCLFLLARPSVEAYQRLRQRIGVLAGP